MRRSEKNEVIVVLLRCFFFFFINVDAHVWVLFLCFVIIQQQIIMQQHMHTSHTSMKISSLNWSGVASTEEDTIFIIGPEEFVCSLYNRNVLHIRRLLFFFLFFCYNGTIIAFNDVCVLWNAWAMSICIFNTAANAGVATARRRNERVTI